MRGRGHGRDNDCSQMGVQVVGARPEQIPLAHSNLR
jgi:hypothetical protein